MSNNIHLAGVDAAGEAPECSPVCFYQLIAGDPFFSVQSEIDITFRRTNRAKIVDSKPTAELVATNEVVDDFKM